MGDTPSLYGRGNYSSGLYSRNYSNAAATVVVNMSVLAKAQRVPNARASLSVVSSVFARATAKASVVAAIPITPAVLASPYRIRGIKTSIVALFADYALADRVKNAETEIPLFFKVQAGFVRVDVRSVIYAAFAVEADPHLMAGVTSQLDFGILTEASASYTASVQGLVGTEFRVLPNANFKAGVSTDVVATFVTYARVEQGSFWNASPAPTPNWVEVEGEDTIWTPVSRERPFDA